MATNGLRRFLRKSGHTEYPEDTSQGSSGESQGTLPASVVRSPLGYACGLCRNQFVSLGDAKACVERCVVKQRLRTAVHVLASPRGTHYRCSLCSRVRVHRDDALRCFEGCLERLRHTSALPHPLVDALDALRTGPGPGLVTRAEGSPTPRGPLFRGGVGALPGHANRGLRGLPPPGLDLSGFGPGGRGPLGGASPAEHAKGPSGASSGRAGAGGHAAFGDLLADAQGPGRTKGGASEGADAPRKPLSAEEMARRTEELLLGDVPEGALIHDVDPFAESLEGAGKDAESVAQQALEGLDDTSQDAFREGASLGELGEDGLADVLGGVSEDAPAPEVAPDPLPTAPASEPPAEKADAGPMKDAQGNIIYREPGMKPFKRADARYVCTACNTKYFTKNEVERCFADHPLKPGSDMA